MKSLWQKYREQCTYLVAGVLTTLVNLVVFWLCDGYFGEPRLQYSIRIAWFVSVLFAYLINRSWVFQSKAHGWRAVALELAKFFGSRVASGIFDEAFVRLAVHYFRWNRMFVKIVSNVVVIVLNYLLSKLFVFRKKA